MYTAHVYLLAVNALAHPLPCTPIAGNPNFFMVNVVIPIFLVCMASTSSFLLEDDEKLYEVLSITLTTLLTLMGMKYITLSLIPQKSYATFADGYVPCRPPVESVAPAAPAAQACVFAGWKRCTQCSESLHCLVVWHERLCPRAKLTSPPCAFISRYVIFSMVTNCIVLAVNCATHGIPSDDEDRALSFFGHPIKKLQGSNKVVVGWVVVLTWMFINLVLIVDALCVRGNMHMLGSFHTRQTVAGLGLNLNPSTPLCAACLPS